MFTNNRAAVTYLLFLYVNFTHFHPLWLQKSDHTSLLFGELCHCSRHIKCVRMYCHYSTNNESQVRTREGSFSKNCHPFQCYVVTFEVSWRFLCFFFTVLHSSVTAIQTLQHVIDICHAVLKSSANFIIHTYILLYIFMQMACRQRQSVTKPSSGTYLVILTVR